MKKGLKSLLSDFKSASVTEKIHTIGVLFLSCVIFATALCFILSCTDIFFNGGESPFSREVVAEYFTRIAPITFICLALVVALGVLSLYVRAKNPARIPLSKRNLLKLTEKKLSAYQTSVTYDAVKESEIKWRRIVIISCAALSALVSAVALIFILNPARYVSDDFNTDIAYSSLIGLAAAVVSFAACYVASYLLDRSYVRQNGAAREELGRVRLSDKASETPEEELPFCANKRNLLIIRSAIIGISVIFIILGIVNGGMSDVLGKAVRICTECIGLG